LTWLRLDAGVEVWVLAAGGDSHMWRVWLGQRRARGEGTSHTHTHPPYVRAWGQCGVRRLGVHTHRHTQSPTCGASMGVGLCEQLNIKVCVCVCVGGEVEGGLLLKLSFPSRALPLLVNTEKRPLSQEELDESTTKGMSSDSVRIHVFGDVLKRCNFKFATVPRLTPSVISSEVALILMGVFSHLSKSDAAELNIYSS